MMNSQSNVASARIRAGLHVAGVRLLTREPATGAPVPKDVPSDAVLEAEAMGSLGWSGTRGKSTMWISDEFCREYHLAQAVKLTIVDAAFAAGFEGARRRAHGDALSA